MPNAILNRANRRSLFVPVEEDCWKQLSLVFIFTNEQVCQMNSTVPGDQLSDAGSLSSCDNLGSVGARYAGEESAHDGSGKDLATIGATWTFAVPAFRVSPKNGPFVVDIFLGSRVGRYLLIKLGYFTQVLGYFVLKLHIFIGDKFQLIFNER